MQKNLSKKRKESVLHPCARGVRVNSNALCTYLMAARPDQREKVLAAIRRKLNDVY